LRQQYAKAHPGNSIAFVAVVLIHGYIVVRALHICAMRIVCAGIGKHDRFWGKSPTTRCERCGQIEEPL
jgi:hypothetical protein